MIDFLFAAFLTGARLLAVFAAGCFSFFPAAFFRFAGTRFSAPEDTSELSTSFKRAKAACAPINAARTWTALDEYRSVTSATSASILLSRLIALFAFNDVSLIAFRDCSYWFVVARIRTILDRDLAPTDRLVAQYSLI